MGELIASRWRELSGENNWEGLLEPLDPVLRRYIIHYCQKAGAMVDLFSSKTKESDAFKQEFFSKACLVKGNPYKYDVTHFIYAGSKVVTSSWFGYVAVATDEGKHALGRRDILVSWRGTEKLNFREWYNNLNTKISSASDLFPTAEKDDNIVHSGFHCLYTASVSIPRSRSKTSARHQVLDALRELVNRYKDEEISITVTGFSLGGALATLTAMDIVANGYNKPTTGNLDKSCMVTAFTFGSPRIGNAKLRNVFGTLGEHLRLLRIVNKKDYFPKRPHGVFSYVEFGEKLTVDTWVSNYLEQKKPSRKRTHKAIVPLEEEEDEEEDEGEGEDEHKSKRSRRGKGPSDESKGKISIINSFWGRSHNIDAYAHGVAIKGIEENTSKDELDHDIALVNKHLNSVKKEYKIPKKWWHGKNREKMKQLENGRWEVV